MTPTIITPLEKLLFGLLILFLPSNLAYHFKVSTAIIQGTLVDYLIPRIYLTDIFILGILGLWLLSSWRAARARHMSLGQLLLILFFFITLITSLLASRPLPSLWFWLKLLEMILLISWLVKSRLITHHPSLITTALIGAVTWQSLLALTQWFKQTSIIGYLFLGEPVFSITTPGIAKTNFFGILKVLPYGTTPHPNVLAGFLSISLAIIWFSLPSFRHPIATISKYIATILALTTLFLTQSISAIFSLGLISILIGLKAGSSSKVKGLLTILLILGLFTPRPWLDAQSLSRRYQLNVAAFKMWLNHPLFGVGLNQFVVYLPQYTEISASTRFLQPVHNIYLLILSETGLIGFVILILLIAKFTIAPLIFRMRKLPNRQSAEFRKILWGSAPLWILLTIGLVDHYPLTLQTGQLLTAISLALATSAAQRSSSPTL